jgi:hypothetical protein
MAGLGDLIKKVAPAAAGAFLGGPGGMAAGIPGIAGLSPFMQRAILSGGIGLLTGQKPQEAILSGIAGGGLGALFPQQAGAPEQMLGPDTGPMELLQKSKDTGLSPSEIAKQTPPGGAGFGAFKGVAPSAEAETISGELLKSLGYAGSDKGNLLFRLMNTKMGEGLAAGLLAQLLSSDEDEGAPKGSYEQRPFGAGGPGGKIGGINYANGGEAYFPRRNGGIDPSEGSGKKDDVPAMLMAGEFVMTRDAVKGAGGGDLRKGIQNMYGMMDNFERMA